MSARKRGSRDGWTRVRFGDVVRLSTERCADPAAAGIDRYVGLEHLEPSDLRIRSWGNVADGVTFTNRFRPGQVLFGKRRAYQRKVAVAEFDGICSSDIYVFEPADDRLLPELLPFICQTDGFFGHALKTSAGSLSPRTNWSSLADYVFELPPMDAQRKYVTVAAAIDDHADATKTLCKASVRLRDCYLSTSFGWAGAGALTFGAFSVPPSWQLLTLPQIVAKCPNALTAGPFGTIFKAKDFRPAGVPIIQLRHITPEGIDCEGNMTYMDTAVYERLHTSYTVVPGDLLLTKMGEPPGLACIYPHGLPVAMVTPDVIKATLDPDIIHASYAPWVFNNPRARANIARLCKGGTRTRVSLGELYKLKWPVPPLSEQLQVIEILESLALAIRSPARDSAMANMKSILSRTLAPTA